MNEQRPWILAVRCRTEPEGLYKKHMAQVPPPCKLGPSLSYTPNHFNLQPN